MLKEGREERFPGKAVIEGVAPNLFCDLVFWKWNTPSFVVCTFLLHAVAAYIVYLLAYICPKHPLLPHHIHPSFQKMTSVTNFGGEKSAFGLHQSLHPLKVTNESCNLKRKSTIHVASFSLSLHSFHAFSHFEICKLK